MTKKQNILLKATIAVAVVFAVAPVSNAMHIMEGYLPASFCIAWGAICLPFIVAGFFPIQKTLKQNRKTRILLAMSGAFVFVISSLKIPSVTGSCSHMTGTGLGADTFSMSIADILVMHPDIIILDEPAAALDPKHTRMVNEMVNQLTDQGITVLMPGRMRLY